MVLCFGTFAKTLITCSIDTREASNPRLVGLMTRTIDPTCDYIYKSDAVSRLLSCTQNLSEGENRSNGSPLSEVVQKALKIDTPEKIDAIRLNFKNNVSRLVDEDKKKQAILALIDIIRNDNTLQNEQKEKFAKYLGTTKENLLEQKEYDFVQLMTGILLYTVTSVRNSNGKNDVKKITEAYVNSFNDPDYSWDATSQTLKHFTVVLRDSFEQAIEQYHIADYIYSEAHSNRIDEFIHSIREAILCQCDIREHVLCKKMIEFCKSLEIYNSALWILDPSLLDHYSQRILELPPFSDILVEVKKDKEWVIERKGTLPPEPVDSIGSGRFPVTAEGAGWKIQELESLGTQLEWVETYYRERSNIHALYSLICDGKKLRLCENESSSV